MTASHYVLKGWRRLITFSVIFFVPISAFSQFEIAFGFHGDPYLDFTPTYFQKNNIAGCTITHLTKEAGEKISSSYSPTYLNLDKQGRLTRQVVNYSTNNAISYERGYNDNGAKLFYDSRGGSGHEEEIIITNSLKVKKRYSFNFSSRKASIDCDLVCKLSGDTSLYQFDDNRIFRNIETKSKTGKILESSFCLLKSGDCDLLAKYSYDDLDRLVQFKNQYWQLNIEYNASGNISKSIATYLDDDSESCGSRNITEYFYFNNLVTSELHFSDYYPNYLQITRYSYEFY